MCLDVFGREIREKRERESAQKLPRIRFFWSNKGSRIIYSEKKNPSAFGAPTPS